MNEEESVTFHIEQETLAATFQRATQHAVHAD